jgi:hypothetical protein
VINEFYQITRAFAVTNSDTTFELRLAFGLVRSLATSTRFILDRNLARAMFLRARFLLEQIVKLDPADYANYRVPVDEVFYD